MGARLGLDRLASLAPRYRRASKGRERHDLRVVYAVGSVPSSPDRGLLVTAAIAIGCGPSLPPARVADQPPMPREIAARERLAEPRCAGELGWLFPGLGQLCQRKGTEAAVIGSVALAESAVVVTSLGSTPDEGEDDPTLFVPLIGLQSLWMYGLSDVAIDRDLAQGLPYAAQDRFDELLFAPFNPCVLSQPDVLAGILGFSAVALGLAHLYGFDISPRSPRDVNYFGQELGPGAGYPLAGATFGATFLQVAIGEESLFRGLLQSRIARHSGETSGWIAASSVFAVAHIPNAWLLEGKEQNEYYTRALPIIAAAGSYLGLSYRWHHYSLAAPVAIHFWYDFILSAADFLANPDDSMLAASVEIPISL